ncbi:calcium-binding protein [Actinoplanes sp. G11-F43]|uniref:calcium-binding protein n=1 Tax=Actinoplanes sp. G11-F43 TaxID=3424130 RepID=UPI003D350DEC
MNLKYRRTLATLGATAAAVIGSTSLLASPAQAATAGLAVVRDGDTVDFRALMGKVNKVKVTISGRTVTIDDVAAIKAGKGCKRVDSTKVKCTTSSKTKEIWVALGDKNDYVRNYTGVFMLADGGADNDILVGGSGNDQLQGGSGNDQITGAGGNDDLYGDSGADKIWGGAGNDDIDGGSGNDTITGSTGNDNIWGGTGNDQIWGGAGNDGLDGGTGNDKIWGGTGNDSIHGRTGNDTIVGEAGNDTIQGYAGNDKIWGGAGNDYVIGNAGNDTLSGGTGDDRLVGEHPKVVGNRVISSGSASAVDKLDGGANTDICLESNNKSSTKACEYLEAVVGSSASSMVPSAPSARVAPQAIS